jgi:hypothetical protein
MHALFITTPAPAEPFDTAESDQDGERTMDPQPGICSRGRSSCWSPARRCRPPPPPIPARPRERSRAPFVNVWTGIHVRSERPRSDPSSTAPCCRCRRRWASRTPISATTWHGPITRTRGRRCWNSAAGSKPAGTRRQVGEWSGSCAVGCGRAGWMWRCCRAPSLCRTMRRSGGRTSPAHGCGPNYSTAYSDDAPLYAAFIFTPPPEPPTSERRFRPKARNIHR